jgi:quercetin dioxygenase-like cupin family protein
MITADIQALKLQDVASRADPGLASRVNFPFSAATGTNSSAVVYFEIDPGKRLGMHRDSAEEIVLVLQGEAEATVDGERGRLTSGSMAVIPAMAPHDIANAGSETLRVVGFFAAATLVHAFYEPLLPNAEVAMFINAGAEEEIFAAAPFGG